VDPSQTGAKQYPGWPITINQLDNYEREAAGYLPPIRVQGLVNPVLKVVNETNRNTLYALRIRGTKFTPAVFDRAAAYTVEVGDDVRGWLSRNGLKASVKPNDQSTIRMIFETAD